LSGLNFNTDVSNIETIGDGLDEMIKTEKEITGWLKKLNKMAEDGIPNKNPGANVK
jgi:hypothetical protein